MIEDGGYARKNIFVGSQLIQCRHVDPVALAHSGEAAFRLGVQFGQPLVGA